MNRFYTASIAALLWVFASTAYSQVFPHYDLTATSGTFVPLVGGTTIPSVQVDDALSAAIPIGFNFSYFNGSFAEIKVSSNGFITFDIASIINYPDNNFTTCCRQNIIAPLWDDLNGNAGTASYLTTGTSPNRVFTVEWLNWKWDYTAPINISFQVKLFETTNRIEFIYRQEGGPLSFPSASIGLMGQDYDSHFSLANASANPVLDPNGFDYIDARPATGQKYTFTESTFAAIQTPTVQSSNIVVTNNAGTTMTVSWAKGNGAFSAVFMKQTVSTTDSYTPTDGIRYPAASGFGYEPAGSGWSCVYNGAGNSVDVDQLTSGASYRIQVIDYNGLANLQHYLPVSATNNPISVTTPLIAPPAPWTSVTVRRTSNSEVSLSTIRRNGTRRAVFVAEESGTLPPLVNNSTYMPNTTFGLGSEVGSSGWYCVHNDFNLPFVLTIAGLDPNTSYAVFVADYNGEPGQETYNTTADATNRKTFTTLHFNYRDYTFSTSNTSFTPIASGTPLTLIMSDEGRQTGIPIGFEFAFAGNPYTTLSATSNGLLIFNPYYPTGTTSSLGFNDLDLDVNRPFIAPLWDDLSGTSGTASYQTSGTAPNRVFTIEWLNWKWNWSATSPVISFQVKLYETSNRIDYVYRSEPGFVAGLTGASIGLGFPNIGSGNFISLNNASASPTISTTTETSNISSKPASGQVYTFTPTLLSQTITFNSLPAKNFGDAAFQLTASASSGLPVTYSSSNTSVATISGNTVTIVGAGTTDITAMQNGDASYAPATPITKTLTVNKADQTISFNTIPTKALTDGPFNLSASASSGLALTFSSSNTSVATVAGNTITLVGLGTTSITATQPGNSNYNAAQPVSQDLTVVSNSQTITFDPIPQKAFGDGSFSLNATASSGLAVQYTSSNTSVATISGNVVTILSGGTTTITALQNGNSTYAAATPVARTLNVSLGNQTISFNAISPKTILEPAFNLVATSSAGLTVLFTSSNPAVATISGNTVTMHGVGMTDITATQPGNSSYNAATPVVRTLTVTKADQTIDFTQPDNKTVGDQPFGLSAMASSFLNVTFFTTSSAITITNNLATIVGPGSVTVRAEQSGNSTYNPAAPVERTICINPAKPAITINTTDAGLVLSSNASSGNQWFRNGTALAGATNQTYVADGAGDYTVRVSADNCQSAPSDAKTVLITGIEHSSSGVWVAPNPVENELLVGGLRDEGTVSLYDERGKLLQSQGGSGTVRLQLGSYPPSMYLVKIHTQNRIEFKKIIKK